MKTTKQQRGVIFQNLPMSIKEVFTDYRTTQKLITLGDEYNLNNEERRVFGKAVGLVLLGTLSMKEFQERLHEKIDGPEKQINKLVREVQESIFQPIAGSLKQLDPEAILAQAEAEEEEGEGEEQDEISQPSLDIPVPPPPGGGGDTPSPSYGGTSDPYREPTDD